MMAFLTLRRASPISVPVEVASDSFLSAGSSEKEEFLRVTRGALDL